MVKKTKKQVRNIVVGRVYIQASFNNTIVSITDHEGNVIAASSAGASGFKGTRKSTPYAAQTAAFNALEKAKLLGLREVGIFVSGVGPGREQAIRAVGSSGLKVSQIKDITPIAHNGVRAKKPRRV